MRFKRTPWTAALYVLGIAGCASVPGEPSIALDGARCQALRSQLDAADGQGIPALADKASNGKSLNPEQRQQVEAYNDAMQSYLSGQCQTQGKP